MQQIWSGRCAGRSSIVCSEFSDEAPHEVVGGSLLESISYRIFFPVDGRFFANSGQSLLFYECRPVANRRLLTMLLMSAM